MTTRKLTEALTIAALLLPFRPLLSQTTDLPLVEPSSLPQEGTFYLLSTLHTDADTGTATWTAPLSFNPFTSFTNLNVDAYWLGADSNWSAQTFVLDDTTVDYSSLWIQIGTNTALRKALVPRYLFYRIRTALQQALTNAATSGEVSADSELSARSFTMDSQDDGDGGDGGYGPMDAQQYTNGLWLEAWATNGIWLGVTLHNTTPGIAYDLLSRESLAAGSVWAEEQQLVGADEQDWTFTWVSMSGRSNLFLRARSWIDSSGEGIADWWQLKYFGHTGVDPWDDPDGDGLSNIAEYYSGTNPTQLDPPSAPVPFRADLSPDGRSKPLDLTSNRVC